MSPGVPARTRSTFLRHQEPAECGKTRSRTGCVLAEAIASSKDLAERRAEREARVVASARLAQDRAATCPAACGPTTVSGDVAPTVRRVFVTRKLTQSQAPRYIAYYSAHWKVDLKCPAKPKDGGKGKKKKKERRKKR